MDTGHLNVTASCIAHLPLIDAEAGKEKGSGRCGSGGLERHSAVGRRIGVAGTRRGHVTGVAVRVHDVGRAGIDITGSVGVARIVVTRTVTVAGIRTVAITGVVIAIARIAVTVAIATVAQSAEAEEKRVVTPVTVPSTPIVSTTHAAATAPPESASTHVTTTAHAAAAVAATTTTTTSATVRDRRGS